MEIKVITLSDKLLEDNGYYGMYEIEIDGAKVFSVYDGEPEDNSLSRNFSDVYRIKSMLVAAYEAGKRQEELEIEEIEVDE